MQYFTRSGPGYWQYGLSGRSRRHQCLEAGVLKLSFMKPPILKFTAFILLIGVLLLISCQKEISCENCLGNPPGSTNKSPIAKAGTDQVITLPTDSVLLDGILTSDPDGMISSLSSVNGLKGAFPDEYHLKNVIHRNGIRGLFT